MPNHDWGAESDSSKDSAMAQGIAIPPKTVRCPGWPSPAPEDSWHEAHPRATVSRVKGRRRRPELPPPSGRDGSAEHRSCWAHSASGRSI